MAITMLRHEVCEPILQQWRETFIDGPPVAILTSATGPLPKRWLLGLSAAFHRVPLVLSGFGMNWTDTTRRLNWTLRAVRLLHGSAAFSRDGRQVHIIFADATDTLLINDPHVPGRHPVPPGRVLVSGECSMFPQCYRDLYARFKPEHLAVCDEHRRAGRFAACYPNAGSFEGDAATLAAWLPLALRTAQAGQGAEAGDDQAAFHHMFLGQLPELPSSARMHVDMVSERFLTLHPCLSDTRRRFFRGQAPTTSFPDGKVGCHDEAVAGHMPLDHVAFVDGLHMLVYGKRHPRGRSVQSNSSRCVPSSSSACAADGEPAATQPVLVHANGLHWMLDALLGKWRDHMRDHMRDHAASQRTMHQVKSSGVQPRASTPRLTTVLPLAALSGQRRQQRHAGAAAAGQEHRAVELPPALLARGRKPDGGGGGQGPRARRGAVVSMSIGMSRAAAASRGSSSHQTGAVMRAAGDLKRGDPHMEAAGAPHMHMEEVGEEAEAAEEALEEKVASLGERLWPPPPHLLAHSVLMLDTAGAHALPSAANPHRDMCQLRTLGEVLPASSRKMSKVWERERELRRRRRRRARNVER